jgi:hypothetical protein
LPENRFAVYRDDRGAPDDVHFPLDFHVRAQRVAPWFIETADDIDLDDHRWEILYVFATNDAQECTHLVAYFTVLGSCAVAPLPPC